ncbi:MAG: hypothetical protein DYG89_38160 [Caldilinea sp. CFX5]|nr:hypothetical protein [Caldilinea sp. CFX5]
MIAITYTISLEGPLLATMLGGDPNSGVSYSYIPGSMIRGMLITRYGSHNNLSISDRELFFSGRVRYLNAYPADLNRSEWQRSLPIPASWRKKKDQPSKHGEIEDWALFEDIDSDSEFKEDAIAVSGSFVWLNEKNAIICSPERQITVHTQRARGPGRATRNDGAVYRYEALAASQHFAGVVLCENSTLAKQVKDLLVEDIAYLGGVQTAGYGRVRIQNVLIVPDTEPWHEYKGEAEEMAKGENLVITLLSDAILRDDYGATHTDLLAALNLPLSLHSAFKQVAVIGGFNRTWGLPLPQTQALGAGSVFVCRTMDKITQQQIEEWLERGVGERRTEGFGRLAFNWQRAERLTHGTSPDPYSTLSTLQLSDNIEDPAYQLAQRMTNRRQRQQLDQALLKAVRSLTIKQPPPNSQLSGIRIIARHALQEGNLRRISNLFKEQVDGNDNPNVMKLRTRSKFERARFDEGTRLNDWIVQLADDPQTVWAKIGQPSSKLGHVEPQQDLAAEYAVRLIDAVLGQAISKRRNRNI